MWCSIRSLLAHPHLFLSSFSPPPPTSFPVWVPMVLIELRPAKSPASSHRRAPRKGLKHMAWAGVLCMYIQLVCFCQHTDTPAPVLQVFPSRLSSDFDLALFRDSFYLVYSFCTGMGSRSTPLIQLPISIRFSRPGHTSSLGISHSALNTLRTSSTNTLPRLADPEAKYNQYSYRNIRHSEG